MIWNNLKQTPESFWARVDKSGGPNACWPWTGGTNNTSYGIVGWHGKVYCAHRVAAWLEGLVETMLAPKKRSDDGHVLHECDNRLCCNKAHWTIGTQGKNIKDCYARGRRQAFKGETNANAKLTATQVQMLKDRYAELKSYAAVAREWTWVSETAVTNAIKGRTYAVGP